MRRPGLQRAPMRRPGSPGHRIGSSRAQAAAMPSPPVAPGTVTEPIEVVVPPAGPELIDDPVPAGLHVAEPPVRGRGRVDRARAGSGLAEQREVAAGAGGIAATAGPSRFMALMHAPRDAVRGCAELQSSPRRRRYRTLQ